MVTLLIFVNCFTIILITLDSLKFVEGEQFEKPKFEGEIFLEQYQFAFSYVINTMNAQPTQFLDPETNLLKTLEFSSVTMRVANFVTLIFFSTLLLNLIISVIGDIYT